MRRCRSLGRKGFARQELAPALRARITPSGVGLDDVRMMGTELWSGFMDTSSANSRPPPGMSMSATMTSGTRSWILSKASIPSWTASVWYLCISIFEIRDANRSRSTTNTLPFLTEERSAGGADIVSS